MAQTEVKLKKKRLSTGATLVLLLTAILVIVAALLIVTIVAFVRKSVIASTARYNVLYENGLVSDFQGGLDDQVQLVDSFAEFLTSQYVISRNIAQNDTASQQNVRQTIYESMQRLQKNFKGNKAVDFSVNVSFIADAFGRDSDFDYDNAPYAGGEKRTDKTYFSPNGELGFRMDVTDKGNVDKFIPIVHRESLWTMAAMKEYGFKKFSDIPQQSVSMIQLVQEQGANGKPIFSMSVLRPIYLSAEDMAQTDFPQKPGVVGVVESTIRLSDLLAVTTDSFEDSELRRVLREFKVYLAVDGALPGKTSPLVVRLINPHNSKLVKAGKSAPNKASESVRSAGDTFGIPAFVTALRSNLMNSKMSLKASHWNNHFFTKVGVPRGERKYRGNYSSGFAPLLVPGRKMGLLIVTPQRYQSADINAVIYPIIGILILSFVLILIGAYFVVRRTIKGVMSGVGAEPQEISELTGYIADGKLYALEQYGHMSGTAVGAFKNVLSMTDALIKFFTRLHSNVRHVSQTSSDLSSNTEEIAGALTEINSTMQMTKDQVNTQQKRVVSVQEELDGLDQNILKLVQVLSEESAAIVESSQSIDAMFSTMTQVSSASDETLKNVKKLEEVSDEGKVRLNSLTDQITTINDQSSSLEDANKMIAGIASRTTLLAMNAAIEAAHAGEAGKGFAVVADEIRNLALQASEQSEQVQSRVKMIKESISQVADSSKLTATSFNAISSSIGSVAELSKQMQGSMEDQVSSAKSVVDKLSEMKGSNASVKASSDKMQEGKNSMLTAMESLSQISQEVNGAIDQIAQAVSEMTLAITNVRDLSSENFNDVKEIQETAKGFQLSESGNEDEIVGTPNASSSPAADASSDE